MKHRWSTFQRATGNQNVIHWAYLIYGLCTRWNHTMESKCHSMILIDIRQLTTRDLTLLMWLQDSISKWSGERGCTRKLQGTSGHGAIVACAKKLSSQLRMAKNAWRSLGTSQAAWCRSFFTVFLKICWKWTSLLQFALPEAGSRPSTLNWHPLGFHNFSDLVYKVHDISHLH